jgi:hypothetical protein
MKINVIETLYSLAMFYLFYVFYDMHTPMCVRDNDNN